MTKNRFSPTQLLYMKLTLFFLLPLCVNVYATGFAQYKITLHARERSLKEIFKDVEKQTDFRFVYSNKILSDEQRLSLEVKDATLDQVLPRLLKGASLNYRVNEDGLVIIYPILTVEKEKQQTNLSGRINDEDGKPLAGINVSIVGTRISTHSNNSGAYVLDDVEPGNIIQYSAVGFITKQVTLQGQTSLNITLVRENKLLDEVTVTGYTSYRRDQSSSAASVVSADKVNQVPMGSIDQILQGRVPGMNVTSSSGQPGNSASVVIRGIGSINGSRAPLYVLDGVPIESNYFQTLNPGDVQEVTVLKDASAKALYGSRGSNGVVLITSKKGIAGRLKVDYQSQYGFSDLTRTKFVMMNTEQRLRFEEEVGEEIGKNIGPGWTYSPKNPDYAEMTPQEQQRANQILDSLRGINTDWRDMFFQQSKFQEQQVSVSGGGENVQFYNSLNYYDQDGIAKRTGMKRYALRSNVDFRSNKFSGNVNLTLGYSRSSFTEGEASTKVGASMASVYYALPYEYPYSPEGILIDPGKAGDDILDLREGSQGLDRLLNSSDKTDQFKSVIGVQLKYQLLPSLSVSTRAGIDYRNSSDQVYINPDSYYGSRNNSNTVGGQGKFGEGSRRNYSIISTTGLTYANTFNEVNDVELSAFYEYVYENYRSFDYTGYGIDERLPETPAGISPPSSTFLPELGGSRTKSALVSYIGAGRYTYDKRYTLTASYRYDGSTKVAQKNRWHGFYSVGVNWNAKAETFLKDKEWLSTLNLRSSYGTTASPFGSDFAYLATYSVNTSYGGEAAIRPAEPGNTEYDWEYVDEFNAGFDLGLLKSERVRISADYYNRITRNMFVDQPLSSTSGFSSLPLSTGKMRNRGVEIDVQGDVIKSSDFTWSLGFNFAYNKNKILALGSGLDDLQDGDTRILKIGLPYGTYYAPQWAGVNPDNGESQYYNKDGSITNTYNENEQSVTKSGSLYPSFTGGFNTGLSYKGISLNAFFSFVSNVKRWNNEDLYNENQRYMTSNQSIRMLEDRWKKPGDHAILQRIDIPRQFTSKDIQDASYLRLRNLNLAYQLSPSIIQHLKIVKSVKIFMQAQNLITWTGWRGLDPENNDVYGRFQYPAARTYTAGLNVNF
ncbi:TonB-linked outer membrane protein, SusC/RagA family [bacterium A37T11]|nr:TonB-linked outer membrane protein, SusC/RagA family [bacterium A37T11]